MRIADQLQVDCPVFYVDNVAEYCSSLAASGGTWGADDIPNIAPPFQRAWVEYRIPGVLVGWLFDAVVIDEYVEQLRSHVHWMVKGTLYLRVHNSPPIRIGEEWIAIDVDGRLIGTQVQAPIPAKATKSGSIVVMWAHPALLAISFLHCKNVKRVENVPGGKFERARKRRGEPPSLKFYTLEIEPMKQVLRTEGRIGEVGLGKALHICRGHFAHYEGAGLFGKYKGTFWRESHVRGKIERGAVVKDYAVDAPIGDK